MTTRSLSIKRAWATRRREGGKGISIGCIFCHKTIYARGVVAEGHPWHKGCYEAYKIGLKPENIGRNPRTRKYEGAGFGFWAFRIGNIKFKYTGDWRKALNAALRKAKELGVDKVTLIKNPKRALRDGFRFYGAKVLNPHMTAREARHLLFDIRDQEAPITIHYGKYGEKVYVGTVRGARSVLYDEPQDSDALFQIVDLHATGFHNPMTAALAKKTWRERKPKALCHFCHHPIWAGGSQYKGKRYHETCLLLHKQKVPSSVMANPRVIDKRGIEYGVIPFGSKGIMVGREDSLPLEYTTPFIKGMKTAKIENPRAKCPKCGKFMEFKGRIGTKSGRFADYYYCTKCRKEFHDRVRLWNPEARPPREWMAEIIPGLKASYPKATREQLGRLAAGIWWRWTPGQRERYRTSHDTAVANPRRKCPWCRKGFIRIIIPKYKGFTQYACDKCGMTYETPFTDPQISSRYDNPLLKGETYLGHTKRGISVSQAKRKGYL